MASFILLNVIPGLGFFTLQSRNKHIGQICRSVSAIYSDAVFEFAKTESHSIICSVITLVMNWQTEGIEAGAQLWIHDYMKQPCQVSDVTFSSPAHSLIIFVILAEDAAILQYTGILISSSPFWNLKKVL